jgi:predicted lipoprotein with Yx(FWY)xxD motif
MKRTFGIGAVTLAAALLFGGCSMMPDMASMSSPAPAKGSDGVLVGPNGMTLYTFDRDAAGSGKSVCNGQCAANWPPLMAGSDAKTSAAWSVVTRDDGTKQWAYQGKPLYYWAKDQKPGDKTGDGINNVWRTAKP